MTEVFYVNATHYRQPPRHVSPVHSSLYHGWTVGNHERRRFVVNAAVQGIRFPGATYLLAPEDKAIALAQVSTVQVCPTTIECEFNYPVDLADELELKYVQALKHGDVHRALMPFVRSRPACTGTSVVELIAANASEAASAFPDARERLVGDRPGGTRSKILYSARMVATHGIIFSMGHLFSPAAYEIVRPIVEHNDLFYVECLD